MLKCVALSCVALAMRNDGKSQLFLRCQLAEEGTCVDWLQFVQISVVKILATELANFTQIGGLFGDLYKFVVIVENGQKLLVR